MNEQQIQKSEQIASKVMRFLAITGLVAILALIAWLVVQGVRMAPNFGQNVTAMVSSITSVFRQAPEERILFDLSSRTLTSGQPFAIRWNYTGPATESARFSYDCARNVTLSLEVDGQTSTLACGETRDIAQDTLTITPNSPEARFADVTLHIARGGVEDATLITVVNTDIANPVDSISIGDIEYTIDDATTEPWSDETEENVDTTESAPPTTTPTPAQVADAPTAAVVAPTPTIVVPTPVKKPADLAVNIESTGVYVDVAGRPTFFAISPIPSDKRAGVVFTVTNTGDKTSGAWAFVAYLPIEGDMRYRYASPVQEPLAPGMQVELTLGFDEVIASGKGLVRIEIIPTGENASTGNDTDAAIVEFK